MACKTEVLDAPTRDVAPLRDRLVQSGVTDFFFGRDEYPERLDVFLAQASRSIGVVAVTFRLASRFGSVPDMLAAKLRSHPAFSVRVSLLAPQSQAADLLAREIGISGAALAEEIRSSLRDLVELRNSLTDEEAARFQLLLHDNLPMGSAYMIDCSPSAGMIHVETKLHGGSQKDILGYRVRGPSAFYSRNFEAWSDILAQSVLFAGDQF